MQAATHEYLRACDNVAAFVQPIVDRIADRYGWTVSLLMAGPSLGSSKVCLKMCVISSKHCSLLTMAQDPFRKFEGSWEEQLGGTGFSRLEVYKGVFRAICVAGTQK